MKKVLGVLIFLTLIFCYLFLYEPSYQGLVSTPLKRGVGIFAHRGLGNYAPDNSMDGIHLAMKEKMDGVDMDGQYTKDGELIIFHDLSVDRLTSGTGRVSEKTLAEMKTLDLATKFGKGYKGSFPGTFEEALLATQGKGILMVELKVPGTKKTGIEERAVSIIQKYNAYSNVYLSSFNPLVLYRLKKLDPNVRTVFIFMDTNWNPELIKEIKKGDLVDLPFYLRSEITRRAIRKLIKPDLLSVNHKVDPKTIQTLKEKGYPIFLWTPNTNAEIKEALEYKPYALISDEPQRVRRLSGTNP